MRPPSPRPGSTAWFLAHDLRLAWRDFRSTFGALGPRSLWVLALLLVGIMHAALWDIAREAASAPDAGAPRDAVEAAGLPVAMFVLLLVLAQALTGVTKLLYARGDLDLVLSSPAPARRVIAVRALAVALGAVASASIFVLPAADDAALAGHPRLLALYPALAGVALAATAAALVIALALFRTVGPRGTRLAAQVLATVIGASFVLALQVGRLLPDLSLRAAVPRDGWLRSAALLPVRAALGDLPALAAWLGLTAACFAAAAFFLGPALARCVQSAAGVGSPPPRIGRRAAAVSFDRGPVAALRLKEWRIIARDPWVVSQLLLQVLYMVPLAALLWSGTRNPALAVSPVIAVVTFQIASSLTWLGLSGEDAPDLLASAPVGAAALRRAKLQAVGGLTLAVVVLPLLYLAWASRPAAAATAAIGAIGLATAVALQSWHAAPARRSAFAARHRESKLMGLVETALSMLFGLAAALAALGSAWALAPLALVGGAVFWLKPRGRARAAR